MSGPLDLGADLEAAGTPLHIIGFRSPYDLRGLVQLTRCLRRLRPDVLHTHLSRANFFGRMAGLLAGVPTYVTSLHSTEYTSWSSRGLGYRIRKLADSIAWRRKHMTFIAVSQAVRTDYIKHFGPRPVDVIYNYIDTERFNPVAPAERARMRRAFGWSDRDLVLLNVGRLDWAKGQDTLVEAMPEILRRVPAAKLLLVGGGPAEEPLRERVRAAGLDGSIVLSGLRQDVPALLAMADVFVFPSLSEGLGIALLEAMAAGLPVVASAVDGITEVVTDGVDGLLVPRSDPHALADAVARLHDDPAFARTLADQARTSATRRFGAEAGIHRLEAIYERAGSEYPLEETTPA